MRGVYLSLIIGLLFLLNSNAQVENDIKFSNLKEINQYLTQQVERNEFSGVVFIGKDGKPIFLKALGYASKRFEVPNAIDTKFNIGSLSKHITSIAVLQLVEKGLLSLDDPIGKYLSDFPEDVAQKVTVRHLLTMSSGWGDYWKNEVYNAHRYEYRTVSDYIGFIKDIPLDFEPGTDMQHSNIGFEIAGAIIEKISGKNYYDYVRKNIYGPAGMLHSDSYDVDGPVKNLAVGYTNEHPFDTEKTGFNWSNCYLRLPARGTPTGGSYSTVEDLFKLIEAHRNHVLLGKLYTNYLLNFLQGDFGKSLQTGAIYHMFGGAEGVGAGIGYSITDNEDIRKGYTIIILSNYDFAVTLNLYGKIKEFVKDLMSN